MVCLGVESLDGLLFYYILHLAFFEIWAWRFGAVL